MKFRTKTGVAEMPSAERLVELVDASLEARISFDLEKAPRHDLHVEALEDGEWRLEVRRGKKCEGWISAPVAMAAARDAVLRYADEPLAPSDGIETRGEWDGVSMLHPALHVAFVVLMISLLVWGACR